MSLLQDQLDAMTARTRELVGPERLATSERAIEDLFLTGIEEKILPVGAQAPECELFNFTGKPVRLADILSFGPVVIKFFRGRWCSYCVTELEIWRDLYAEVRERGALLVAVSPQTVRQNDFLAGRHALPFPVLSDPGCELTAQFGLAWELPEDLRDSYRSIMADLPFINGDESWRLPLPATYVLDRTGHVTFAEAHADFRVRPEPVDVLAALDGLK